jgi:pimeloyl-ACP methyl ester carboxylesterase
MTTIDDEAADYDEFGLLQIYADYEGIPWKGRPEVVRRSFEVAPRQRLSAIQWGSSDPELVLLQGRKSAFVHDEDEARLRELQPAARVELVDGAGHSVQSDRPLVLAGLIADFLASTP